VDQPVRDQLGGAELAHDLYEHGADLTMLQRSSTYVITYETYHRFFSTRLHGSPKIPPIKG
jgi:cation diffusion facilitator CzcD-associated flavoprotein CzcO